MNLGIFLPNWVGDVTMCTPTLRALRKHFGPKTRITGILRPNVVDVLAGTRWLDELLLYDYRSGNPKLRIGGDGVLRQIRQRQFDMVIMLTNSYRAAALAWCSGARQRVGYVRNLRGALLTHKLYYPRLGRKWLPTPAIDSYLQLAYAVGCELEPPRLELATLPIDEAAADAVWHKHQLPPGNEVVVLNSGGAYGAAKLWPSSYFAQLARRIAERHELAVLVTCGPAEREVARAIVAAANHPRVVGLADEPVSIGLTKACIRRCRLLISTDSGPRFFAVAFDVPLVSLFGPTNMGWTRTHFERETCLQHAVACGPCSRRACPLRHHDCMRLLSVDRVYEAAARQLMVTRTFRAA